MENERKKRQKTKERERESERQKINWNEEEDDRGVDIQDLSTPSMLLSIYIWFVSCRNDQKKQKEAGRDKR